MHYGEFVGKHATEQEKRILILGESHHIDNKSEKDRCPREVATYTTESVIRSYYVDPKNKFLRFFDKIAQSFGIDTEFDGERERFWETVYFGNYIDVLCGIGDNTAKNIIKQGDNRKQYNDELFQFINENEIDTVFCFSRLVYNSLPSLSKIKAGSEKERIETIPCGTIIGKRDYISTCKYLANTEHGATDVILHKDLTVFGMRHPSARGGFDSSHYADILKRELQKK